MQPAALKLDNDLAKLSLASSFATLPDELKGHIGSFLDRPIIYLTVCKGMSTRNIVNATFDGNPAVDNLLSKRLLKNKYRLDSIKGLAFHALASLSTADFRDTQRKLFDTSTWCTDGDLRFLNVMKKLSVLYLEGFFSQQHTIDPIPTLKRVIFKHAGETASKIILSQSPNIEELAAIPSDQLLEIISQCSKLKVLRLEQGTVSKKGLAHIAKLSKLEKLSFQDCNGLKTDQSDLHPDLLSLVAHAPKLTELSFASYLDLPPEFLEALIKAKSSPHLNILCVSIFGKTYPQG